MKNYLLRGIWAAAVILTIHTVSPAQNPKLDEIIAKHLDSIGKKEIRDLAHNYMLAGISEFESKLPTVRGGGKAVIISDPENLYFLLSLNSKEYAFEKIGYFKDKISLPYVSAGTRSPLGAFVADHPTILTNGILFGSMTDRWILSSGKGYGGKVFASGSKKVNGKKAYVLEYFPSDGASTEFKIRIYIDAETFHHVRTEYDHEIAPKEDVFGTLGRMAGTRLTMVEDFGEFQNVEGLTLPFLYKVKYTTSSQSGTYEFDWSVRAANYFFNQKLAPDFFSFETK